MSEKLIITFDKSVEDIPVLSVAREGWSWGFSGSATNVINTFVGDNAEVIYNLLAHRKDYIENMDKINYFCKTSMEDVNNDEKRSD